MIPNLPLLEEKLTQLNQKTITPTAKGTAPATGTYSNVQRSIDSGRTSLILYANAAAVGATTVETAVTWTIASGTSATTTGVTYAVPTGKKLRITSVHFATVGNATGALATTIFNIRANASGAVVVGSTPVLLSKRLLNGTANLDYKSWDMQFPEGLEIAAGINIGITTNCTYAAGAPTSDVMLVGYLY